MRRAARVLTRNNKGEILLVHTTKKGRNRWEMPGGKVDPGELPKDTAQRECLEETGVQVEDLHYLCTRLWGEDDGEPWEIFYFIATMSKGEPSNREPEKADAVKYVYPSNIDGLPQIPRMLVDVVRFALKGATWPA